MRYRSLDFIVIGGQLFAIPENLNEDQILRLDAAMISSFLDTNNINKLYKQFSKIEPKKSLENAPPTRRLIRKLLKEADEDR